MFVFFILLFRVYNKILYNRYILKRIFNINFIFYKFVRFYFKQNFYNFGIHANLAIEN